MNQTPRPLNLQPPFDPARDHALGAPTCDITLLEYGSYACPACHAAHDVVTTLRDRFGERLRYVFRHYPIERAGAWEAAHMAEVGALTAVGFWPVHDALMKAGPDFAPGELPRLAAELGLPSADDDPDRWQDAAAQVRRDAESARTSGALVTPTFYINGRRYEGPWDETELAEAMLGSLGHRIQAAALDFARWAPSAGFLLFAMAVLAVVLTNTAAGPAFEALWRTPVAVTVGEGGLTLPLLAWINDGLLTLFFLVVGLEIKREFTVGRLASRQAAALPAAAAIGGMVAPAVLYLAFNPSGPWTAGWGVPIATDTAFAVALIVMLGTRVPVELRVFLTAAAIVDDLVAIAVVALFYSTALNVAFLLAAAAATLALVALNRSSIYHPLPYAVLGAVLWLLLHEAGVHATLAGVVLAMVTPTRPPANLRALMAHADTVIRAQFRLRGEDVMRHGPSETALRALDRIFERIESPASRMLRTVEPWSSYLVLPLFAFANAGVAWSADAFSAHGTLMAGIAVGLVVGKPVGLVLAAFIAVRLGLARKPPGYTWRQMMGAGLLAGIGFTMSLFIAAQAFPQPADFAAAKIAVFGASILAAVLGVAVLWITGAREREGASGQPPAR